MKGGEPLVYVPLFLTPPFFPFSSGVAENACVGHTMINIFIVAACFFQAPTGVASRRVQGCVPYLDFG